MAKLQPPFPTEPSVELCVKGHHHFSSSWSIYVIDPNVAVDQKSYRAGLYSIDYFDTKEELDNLYSKTCFSPPKSGPPSWSMVVPGGAIAVFRGGMYGCQRVEPEWEDPAAKNGGEFRFAFSAAGMQQLELLDDIFRRLCWTLAAHWPARLPAPLGFFCKNINSSVDAHQVRRDVAEIPNIQFRVWVAGGAEEGPLESEDIADIGYLLAKIIGDLGAVGRVTYKPLQGVQQSGGTHPELRLLVPLGREPEYHRQNPNKQRPNNGPDLGVMSSNNGRHRPQSAF